MENAELPARVRVRALRTHEKRKAQRKAAFERVRARKRARRWAMACDEQDEGRGDPEAK